jgi:type VI secretion system protein ImpM
MGRFVYGKHPAFGDFVTAGLSDVAQDRIESWLNASLSTLKTAWGTAWEHGFDTGPTIAFWLGARVTGSEAVRGAMMPSRDKVGRRFPLLAGCEGPGALPPAVDPADTYCADIANLLVTLEPEAGKGAQGMLELMPEVDGEDVDADPAFWAARDDGDQAQLWCSTRPQLLVGSGRADLALCDRRLSSGRGACMADDRRASGWGATSCS